MFNFLFKVFSFVFIFIVFLNSSASAKIGTSPYKIVQDPNGVYVVEINTAKAKNKLVPYYVNELKTNAEVYKETGARLVVNAGFFDPKNMKTVSYVTINGQVVLNPEHNENLMQNEALKPYMDKILNRSEFRVLEDAQGLLLYDIAPHNEAPPEGYIIKHSIQAGPMLFTELRLEEEFFVLVKDGKIVSESASALHKYARTAIGVRDKYVYLFIVTKDAPMNLEELGTLARRWGCQKAMAFDGGGSTSFDARELHIISEKDDTARRLKSFLILK